MMIILCALLFVPAVQDPADVEKNVAALVRKLQSGDADERARSEDELVALGERAAPAVENAAASVEGDVRARLKKVLRAYARTRWIREVPVRWKDAWCTIGAEAPVGWIHLTIEPTKDGYVVKEEALVENSRRLAGSTAGWSSEVRCKADLTLTPVSATCSTHVNGKTVMEVACTFADGRMKAAITLYRKDTSPDEPFAAPKTSTRAKDCPGNVIIQPALLPAISLIGRAGTELAEFTFIEFPDDIDGAFNLKKGKFEFPGLAVVEVGGKQVEGVRVRSRWAEDAVVTPDDEVHCAMFKRTTEETAKAVVAKKE
jgi:hypothetical protein